MKTKICPICKVWMKKELKKFERLDITSYRDSMNDGEATYDTYADENGSYISYKYPTTKVVGF